MLSLEVKICCLTELKTVYIALNATSDLLKLIQFSLWSFCQILNKVQVASSSAICDLSQTHIFTVSLIRSCTLYNTAKTRAYFIYSWNCSYCLYDIFLSYKIMHLHFWSVNQELGDFFVTRALVIDTFPFF